MDARITKQRLSNLISYDWIKILCTVAAALLVLSLLFAVTATRPLSSQQYNIFVFTDLSVDTSFSQLADELEEDDVFSYDILTVGTEAFTGTTGNTTYGLRRSVGTGNVLFVTDNPVYEQDEAGNPVLDEEGDPVIETQSTLYSLAMGITVANDEANAGGVYDTVYYMDACERYLAEFFGDDWRSSDAFDGSRSPEESFYARNGSDKRYRTEQSRAQGVEDEKARLLELREDYLAVDAAFDEGLFTHTSYENDWGEASNLGINVGGLHGLKNLVYYTDGENSRTTENINLVLLFNGKDAQNDLRFESISFLNYLLENYREE